MRLTVIIPAKVGGKISKLKTKVKRPRQKKLIDGEKVNVSVISFSLSVTYKLYDIMAWHFPKVSIQEALKSISDSVCNSKKCQRLRKSHKIGGFRVQGIL